MYLATIYQFVGDFKNSHLHFEKSLSINPNATEIYRIMSMTKKFKKTTKILKYIKIN